MPEPRSWHGHGVVRGVAVGPAHDVRRPAAIDTERRLAAEERPGERARLDAAVEAVVDRLERLADQTRERGAPEEAEIFDAHGAILLDPALRDRMAELVGEGMTGDAAATVAGDELAERMAAAESAVLRERAADFRHIALEIVGALGEADPDAPEIEAGAVLVAADLTPSETAVLDVERVAGIALAAGGPTGHVAILARSLGIPAVVGAGFAPDAVGTGDAVAVDGDAGDVLLAPDAGTLSELHDRQDRDARRREAVQALHDQPAATADGRRVELAANIGRKADVEAAVQAGAEGAGLVRSELLYADRGEEPTEDEQHAFLRDVVERLAPHRVVVRTLDVGADKPLAYLPQAKEGNPFLGLRGIRLSLRHPDTLCRQLRAALRAAARGRVGVMFPFVTEAEDLDAALDHLAAARDALHAAGTEIGELEVGVMVEVPALALALDEIVDRVDFVSIGTNDLVQYLFAADRTNAATAQIGDVLHPGCLRLIDSVVRTAHAHDRWVGVCGEAASDPLAALVLVGLGTDELSAVPGALGDVKAALAEVEAGALEDLARWALTEARGAAEVRSRAGDLVPALAS